jgi:SAM-dependent methyltransferase
MTENQAQIDYWNSAAGLRWVTHQDRLDALIGHIGELAMDAAHPAAGERILDVGCGCGATTLALAERARGGRVVGLDVSAPMLARARQRVGDRADIELLEGDAARLPLPAGGFDLVFSRFGVMFFADATAAFTHLHAATAPGGRLAFVCWRALTENPWTSIGLNAMAGLDQSPPYDPEAPGPFSLARPEKVRAVLDAAGWRDVTVTGHDVPLRYSDDANLDAAAEFYSSVGPVARILATLDEERAALGRARVRTALAPHLGADGCVLPGAVWVVTARAS